MSLVLGGSKHWSGNKGGLAKMEVLRHKKIRRVLDITIGEAKEEEKNGKEARRRFGGCTTTKEA